MSKKEVVVETVSMKKVVPDPKQPRKLFNAERLADLKNSISKHGIMSPLLVEKQTDGTFLLVDGERRYRAAQELGLNDVPVIVLESSDDTQRLLQQFHIQEQHEAWTPVEKAVAVVALAEKLKVTPAELARQLAIPARSISEYVAFSNLLSREEFQKQEVSIHFARQIVATRQTAKRLWAEVLKEDFDQDMQQELEIALMARIKSGEIKNPTDMVKVKDSIKMDPRAVLKIMKGKSSIDRLFLETRAEVAAAYRNAVGASYVLTTKLRQGMTYGGDFSKLITDVDKRSFAKSKELLENYI